MKRNKQKRNIIFLDKYSFMEAGRAERVIKYVGDKK